MKGRQMNYLSIGQLAEQANVNIETIRYYERRGLIPQPPRRESGYRKFSQTFVVRIKFIKRAQELGFTLKKIQELLSMRVDPDTTCSDIKIEAKVKMGDIDGKIKSLQRMKRALTKLVAKCDDSYSSSECPILDYLGTEDAS